MRRRGKDGAVIEAIEKVPKNYEYGWRAYLDSDGEPFFKDTNTDQDFSCYGLMNTWHALRAYQDEQRKKGVPIVMTIPEAQAHWFHLDCHHDGILYNFHAMPKRYGIAPEITVGHDLAKFTNFRWRKGYPKGGQNG